MRKKVLKGWRGEGVTFVELVEWSIVAIATFLYFVRLLWVLQEEHPPEPDLHVQGAGRLQGPLPHRQDAQEPVQGLQAQEVLRVVHEQRW